MKLNIFATQPHNVERKSFIQGWIRYLGLFETFVQETRSTKKKELSLLFGSIASNSNVLLS